MTVSAYNLVEVRFFMEILKSGEDTPSISEEKWGKSKTELVRKFGNSSKIEVCKNLTLKG